MTLAHKSIVGESGYLDAVGFAENADRSVNCLDVVGGADIAVRIGRAAGAPVEAVETFKDVESGGRRRVNPRCNGRNRGLGSRDRAARGNVHPRIQRWTFELWAFPLHRFDPRKSSEIAVKRARGSDQPGFLRFGAGNHRSTGGGVGSHRLLDVRGGTGGRTQGGEAQETATQTKDERE